MGGPRSLPNGAPACESQVCKEGGEVKGKEGKEKRTWSGIVLKKASERTGDEENAENGDAGHAKRGRGRRERGSGAPPKKEAGKGKQQRKPLAERKEDSSSPGRSSVLSETGIRASTSSPTRSSVLSEKGPRGRPRKSVEPHLFDPSATPDPSQKPQAPGATVLSAAPPPVDRPLAINECSLGIGALIRLRDALTEEFLVLPREGFGPTSSNRHAPTCPPLRICAAQLLAHVQIGLGVRAGGRVQCE
ncbi:hypothetical protein T484DRAFT_1785455, partial [Baffinella frigidus]